MSLSPDVDLEEFILTKDDLSGADIKAVCTEAGLLALRERRMRVTKADFTTAREKVCHLFIILKEFFIEISLFLGALQEKRRNARRIVLVVLLNHYLIFSFSLIHYYFCPSSEDF